MYHTPFQTNYTAVTESGADWIVKLGVKFVGIDYLSIATYEELATAHQSLMRAVCPLHHSLLYNLPFSCEHLRRRAYQPVHVTAQLTAFNALFC